MPVSLKNQVVLVVGASSGIGRETAVLFAREGARVTASARREDRLRGLQDTLAQEGFRIEIAPADASKVTEIAQVVNQTRERAGKIDIVVFATGTNTPDRALTRLTPAIWDELVTVNLNGAYYITHAVLPAMRNAGSGHLIYVSSISGLVPDVSGAAYQAGKRGTDLDLCRRPPLGPFESDKSVCSSGPSPLRMTGRVCKMIKVTKVTFTIFAYTFRG